MKNKPLYVPVAILITMLTLGFSVPAFFLANRSGKGAFVLPEATPTTPMLTSVQAPEKREPVQQSLDNCTYHAYHWESQPEAWPLQITLGGITYTKADMLKLRSAQEGDPAIDLLKEAIIAVVNIYNGASMSRIESTLVEADQWLSDHQADSELSQFNKQQALSFASTLANFNNGRLFPKACADQVPLPTAEIASAEITLPTATSTAESLALNQSAPVQQSQPNSFNDVQPAPAQPTPQPTNTPVPMPTDIPPPPTSAPIPQPVHPAPPAEQPPVEPPTGNPGNGNPGQGNGNGNGNGNPGNGNGNGNGNGDDKDKSGEGGGKDKGGDKDKSGEGGGKDKGGDKDKSGEGGGKDKGGDKDKSGEGGGKDKGDDKDKSGSGDQGGGKKKP